MAFSQRRFRMLAATIASVTIFFTSSLCYFCNIPYPYNCPPDLPLIIFHGLAAHAMYLAIASMVFSGAMSQKDRRAAGLPPLKEVPEFFFFISEEWAKTRIGVRVISIFAALTIFANLMGYGSTMAMNESVRTVMGWLTLRRFWAPMSYVADVLVHTPIMLCHLGAVVYVLFFWPQTVMPAKENAGPWHGDGVERGEITEKTRGSQPRKTVTTYGLKFLMSNSICQA